MRFGGSPERRSVSTSARVNLPAHVEADVEYRDVDVDYTLATQLNGRTEHAGHDGQSDHMGDPGEDENEGEDEGPA